MLNKKLVKATVVRNSIPARRRLGLRRLGTSRACPPLRGWGTGRAAASGMGLSPAAWDEGGRRLPRFPQSRVRPALRTASSGPNGTQPAAGLPAGPRSGRSERGASPHRAPTPGPGAFWGRSPCPSRPSDLQKEESVGSQALDQLLPKQPQQDMIEQGRSSVQQGEKPIVSLESTSNLKRTEWNSTPKPGTAGRLTKQAAEDKPKPRPGDLIEIFRIGYEHWAIYVEDDCVVHLASPSKSGYSVAGTPTPGPWTSPGSGLLGLGSAAGAEWWASERSCFCFYSGSSLLTLPSCRTVIITEIKCPIN